MFTCKNEHTRPLCGARLIRIGEGVIVHVACARLTALVAVDGTTAAAPLSPFRCEAQAQPHCSAEAVAWPIFRKGIYYLKRQKRYAQGSTERFVCARKPAAAAIAARSSGAPGRINRSSGQRSLSTRLYAD
jgi:hypothetical protein